MNQPTLPVRLQELLDFLELEPGEADLILDLQMTDGSGVSLPGICDGLPSLHQWRTFTVASGAFPKDLRGFQVGQHVLARSDWHNWRDGVTNSGALSRLPSFSDYTIQHPIFGEPPEFPNTSASVRYTHYDYWVIMRGEGLRNDNGPGFDQYPANALLLCERDEFCGAAFSYGDAYIHGIAEQTTQTGGLKTWLRAGINHHMTLVVRQIASLFVSSVVAAL